MPFTLPADRFPNAQGGVDQDSHDACISANALLRYQAKHHSDRPYLCELDGLSEDGSVTYTSWTFAHVLQKVEEYAAWLDVEPRKSGEEQKVIAVIMKNSRVFVLIQHAIAYL